MRLSAYLAPLAASFLLTSPVLAQDEDAQTEQAQEEVSSRDYIAFPNLGGVRDWHAEGRDVIYFQDRQKRWYRAELTSPSPELRFVHFIGIDTRGPDRLDKWSTVYIDGRPHTFSTFEAVPGDKPWETVADEAEASDG